MTEAGRLRVLSIAHPAVTRDMGRRRYHPLAERADLDVHLLVPRRWRQFGRTIDADASDDPGVTLHVLPIRLAAAGPLGWYLHFYPGLPALMRALRPDVVHLWEEPWSVVALQASLLKGDASLVLEVDQNILKRLPPPFEAMRRHVLRRTAHVLSRSRDATTVVRAGGYRGPVTPIGYGVDERVFSPVAGLAGSGITGPGLRLGYVGRLVEEKGLDDALEAMVEAPASTLAILGEGPHEEPLRRRADALGLRDRVTFRGWAPAADVAGYMRGLDALLLLTRTTGAVREQFGRVIIEAQACGVPVIGSRGGAIPDIVGPGGWIVGESAPAGLAVLLRQLAATPGAVAAAGRAGQANVRDRFTYPAVARALADAWVASAGARVPATTGLAGTVERLR